MSHIIVDSGEFIIALPVDVGCREKDEIRFEILLDVTISAVENTEPPIFSRGEDAM